MSGTTLKRGTCSHYPRLRPQTKAGSLLLLLAFGLVCNGEEITLTTTAGRKIENAAIRRVEADGVVLVTDSGIEKIPFAEMSPEIQRKFGHDPGQNAARSAATPDAPAGGQEISLTTLEGRKIEKATLVRIEPDGLVLTTDAGIEKIRFAELNSEVQKRYGYNPAAAAKFAADVSHAAAQRTNEANQIMAAKTAAENLQAQAGIAAAENRMKDAKAAMEASRKAALARGLTPNVIGEVIQCTDAGVVIDCTGSLVPTKFGSKRVNASAIHGVIFVKGIFAPLHERVGQYLVQDGFSEYQGNKIQAFRLP